MEEEEQEEEVEVEALEKESPRENLRMWWTEAEVEAEEVKEVVL